MTIEYNSAEINGLSVIFPEDLSTVLGPYADDILAAVPCHTVFVDPNTFKGSTVSETAEGLASLASSMLEILDSPYFALKNSFKVIATKVLTGLPFAGLTSFNGTPIGFVQLPDSTKPDDIITLHNLAKEDQGSLEALPFHDAAALATLHELGHLTDDPTQTDLQHEIKNDSFAITNAPRNLPNESCEKFLAMRAMNTVHNFGMIHDTAPYIICGDTLPPLFSGSMNFSCTTRDLFDAGIIGFNPMLTETENAPAADAFSKLKEDEKLRLACECIPLSPDDVAGAILHLNNGDAYDQSSKIAAYSYLAGYDILSRKEGHEANPNNPIAKAVQRLRASPRP